MPWCTTPPICLAFFSVFNPDAVKDIDVTKGTMPARLWRPGKSSVLDIGLKEGNARKTVATSGGLGLISSRLTVRRRPSRKTPASYILSGRRTYLDVLAQSFCQPRGGLRRIGLLLLRPQCQGQLAGIAPQNQFYLSGYFGRDVFDFRSSAADFGSRIPWGNATVTARWNHVINDKAFLTTTATYSDYEFAFEAQQDSFIFGFRSGIDDRGLKSRD